MKIEELLPVGSVVLLKEAQKKIIIMGVMQIKKDESEYKVYDYLGVPYPEGYIGEETTVLFDRESIQEVIFKGYADEEREKFCSIMQKVLVKAEKKLGNVVNELFFNK